MRTLLLAALLAAPGALLASAALQDPPGRREPNPPMVTPRTREEFHATIQAMQGCWQLVDVSLPGFPGNSRQEVAFMLVSQEFLSIEIHMGYTDDEEQLAETFFQSGTYRLAADSRGLIETTTLIGSVFDDRERLVFEQPGLRRLYNVETTEETVVLLRHPDRARFVFDKLRTLKDYDFYGRPLPEEEETPGEGGRKRK